LNKFDFPPIWLLLSLLVAWSLARFFPQTVINFVWQGKFALILLGIGLVLNALAFREMSRAKTTIIPHQDPNELVTSGIFSWTRNPIYLGDMFFLGAGIVWWGSISALPLFWLFARVIEKRFIKLEEAKMRAFFGVRFDEWCGKTRRWL